MKWPAAIIVAAVIATGCATMSQPVDFFTLSAAANLQPLGGGAEERPELSIGVGPAQFPEYLDRPQLVQRNTANRLEVDEFRRWGGSLQDDFLRVLGENLSVLLGTSRIAIYPEAEQFALRYRVVLGVQQFERIPDGRVLLSVRWAVLDPRTERALLVRQSRLPQPVTGPGYDGVIAAKNTALAELSREVARAIATLER